MPEIAKTNWRLMRVAEQICQCDLTDGFCHPKNKPDCKCWKYARLAIRGIENQANAALADAWPNLSVEGARAHCLALCRSILNKSDELTHEHFELRCLEGHNG